MPGVHDFGNHWRDGYTAKSYEYKPGWEMQVDYNPDHRRSTSATYIEDRGKEILWVMQVKGLGAIVMRADSDKYTGRLNFKGVSEFSDQEIGWKR
jgi:hypothetical protein